MDNRQEKSNIQEDRGDKTIEQNEFRGNWRAMRGAVENRQRRGGGGGGC